MLTVAETDEFLATARAFWNDDQIADFVTFIAEHPDAGAVIPGSGGLRKVRWAASGSAGVPPASSAVGAGPCACPAPMSPPPRVWGNHRGLPLRLARTWGAAQTVGEIR